MNGFTASNGAVVERVKDGLAVHTPLSTVQIAPHVKEALREYFSEAEPWRDARRGDVWVLDFGTGETPWVADVRRDGLGLLFERGGQNVPIDSDRIISGRRIWPEVAK